MKQIQQGDVTIERIESIPTGTAIVIEPRARGFVLADGESTGHAHTLPRETDADLVRIGEKMLLTLREEATLTHEEHNPITLSPGIYEIGQVYEMDHLEGMTRKVID